MDTKPMWATTRTGLKIHAFEGKVAKCHSGIKQDGNGSDTYRDVCAWVTENPKLSLCGKCEALALMEEQARKSLVDQAHAEALEMNEAIGAKIADAPCCEHASMYHGAKGCGECSCTTARADMTAHQGTATNITTENNDMTNPRPITGPLTRRQTQVMDLLLDDRRQTEVATTLGVSAPYVSEEAQIASRKLKARTTNGGVANYATAKAYIQAAELIEASIQDLYGDPDFVGVNEVLDGVANILRERAGRLLPQ